jgi:TadE-like protein
MVEFVLIAPLLFVLVGGIVQMALALNYWLDMQRIANQGARWAVVARYPLDDGTMCTKASLCTAPEDRLQDVLRRQAQSDGLRPVVCISFPADGGADTVGDPLQVRLETDFSFVPILGIGTVTLGADAEMRIEQDRGSPPVYEPACVEPPPDTP